MEAVTEIVGRMVAPLVHAIRLMIGRALLTAVSTADTTQRIQIRGIKGEVSSDDLPHFQPHGFLSVPLPGASVVMLYQGGDRGFGAAIVIDDPRYRPTGWLPGEVGLYDHLGKFIRLREDDTLEENAPTIVLNASERIEFTVGQSSIVITEAGITMTTPSFDLEEAS